MPSIRPKSFFSFVKNEDEYPSITSIERLRLHCDQCGNDWDMLVPEEMYDYKKMSEYWRDQYNTAMSKITELMRFSELYYGMNPQCDILVKKMDDLRRSLNDEEEN